MTQPACVPDETLAVVCFTDNVGIPWLKMLKPGFRHCAVVVRTGGVWVGYDPMSHRSDLAVGGGQPVLPVLREFRRQGARCVLARIAPEVPPEERRAMPWRPYTCVEAVKRVLGLRAPGVFTPWQLFCHLREEKVRQRAGGNWVPGRPGKFSVFKRFSLDFFNSKRQDRKIERETCA